ncbi:MAG TPA: valine--tRNA ligase [Pseudomonas sp.]|nr:valine--tRNA ligase [Pseudomonas sp.]
MDKTYQPHAIETSWYQTWESNNYFAPQGSGEPYTIMIPPPNVTGSLHMGHGFNNAIMDALIRFRRMQGRNTLWQPGTDHAGIATQMVVERQLGAQGVSRHDLGREKFLDKVWQWKEESGGHITRQIRRLGSSVDWSRERFTMDEGLSEAVKEAFVRLHEDGLIYRGKRLVNWDTKLHTAISDLEVENHDEKGHLWHLRYPLADGCKTADGEDYLVVATTRPETMLGDAAVAVHPEDERYKNLIGRHIMLPLVNRLIPIIADDYVDLEFGTGCVKITPAHDFNDYEVGKRHHLPLINIFDQNACILARAQVFNIDGSVNDKIDGSLPDGYAHMDRFDARKAIVAEFDAMSLLEKIDDHGLKVPRGDRSGTIIEPWLTDQWYVSTKPLAEKAIAAVESGDIQFVPKQYENMYFSWMRDIQDWCISRQLWWGHRIPAWYDEAGNVYVGRDEVEVRSKYNLCNNVELRQDEDVLDTWFSSGLWTFSTLGWPEQTDFLKTFHPTDVLVTGFDIIFFWVARMMMMQYAVVGQKPFSHVYVHALVRDEKGKKMSKSLGNVLDPLDLIDEFGADAVRFTLTAMAAMGRDLKLSKERVAGYRNFTTKLWNAARFAEMNGATAAAADPTQYRQVTDATQTVNKWIIGETAKTRAVVDEALENFRFNDAANALYVFVWGTVCDWYVEFSKPLLMDGDDATKAETQATMAWVIDQCLILLHPIMPFVTEELWGTLGQRAKMLVHADWPDYGPALVDPAADREMNWVIALIEQIRSARAQMHVPAGLYVPLLVSDLSDAGRAAWARNEMMIKRLARIDSLTDVESFPKGCVTVAVEGGTFGLPLADIIDVTEEKARLEKTLAKLEKELSGLRGRLGNPNFVESAPEDVVAETRDNLALREDEEAKLRAALDRLAELG